MVPLNLLPSRFTAPDFILGASIAMVIRKASFLPYWLVGSIFLIADILLSRPMGLWAFIALVTVEVFRANRIIFRDMFFIAEWAIASFAIIAMFMAQQFLLTFSLANAFPIDGVLRQIGMTIAAYPVIVFIITNVFGIRKPSPAEINMLGSRL